jgi:transposase-like protein
VTHQIPAETKAQAVLRVLRGEDSRAVAQELGVSRQRLERWEREFVAAGQDALHRPRHRRLLRRIRKRGKAIAQYAGLLLVLALTVLALMRFMESGS